MNNLPLAVVAAGLAICCLAASSLSAGTEARKPGSCALSIGGKAVTAATHAIAAPDKPTPQEAFAAADLAEHIWLLTGQRLAVVRESNLPGAKIPLVVGRCEALLKKLKVDANLGDLGEEGIVIRSAGATDHAPRASPIRQPRHLAGHDAPKAAAPGQELNN